MIGKHSRGWNVGGLLRYLMGPGRANEHTAQRVVGAWTGDPAALQPAMRDPAALASEKACGFDVRDLATQLTTPAHFGGVSLIRPAPDAAGKVAAGPVWHCSLRNHESDRVLSDAEWARVAEDVMHRTGIAPRGDRGGCRWVAIRHADDHVHIAAVLVRQDTGRRVHPRRDWPATMAACHAAEARLGLTTTAPADRTALAKPTRAETEKARRRHDAGTDRSAETARTWLTRTVRAAAAASSNGESFLVELQWRQVLVETRRHPGGRSGLVYGMVGDRTKAGGQVWFAGSTLAPDLSWPKLSARWVGAPGPARPDRDRFERVPQAERDAAEVAGLAAIEQATDTLADATAALRAAGPGAIPEPGTAERVAGIIHAAGDMAAVLAERTEGWRYLFRFSDGYLDRPSGQVPVSVFARAIGQPGVGQPRRFDQVAVDLRVAARGLAHAGADGAALLLALLALIAEVTAWHEQTRHLAQARAARTAGELFHAQTRPPGHPEQAAAPGRTRQDSRRPEPGRDRGAGPRWEAWKHRAAQERLEQLRAAITEQAMSRRPEAGHTDTELAALIARAEQNATGARAVASRVRAELAQLEPQVAAGNGPTVHQLHAQLTELRECVRLHHAADEQTRQRDTLADQGRDESSQGRQLRGQAEAGGLRWPGQRARLRADADQLLSQGWAHTMASIEHGWEATRLRQAAAEHGPRQACDAYTALAEWETSWPHRAAAAHNHDAGRVEQLRAELQRAETAANTADDTANRLTGERRHRDTQPPRARAAENEIRRTRHTAAAAGAAKKPAAPTPRPRPVVGPRHRPPGPTHGLSR